MPRHDFALFYLALSSEPSRCSGREGRDEEGTQRAQSIPGARRSLRALAPRTGAAGRCRAAEPCAAVPPRTEVPGRAHPIPTLPAATEPGTAPPPAVRPCTALLFWLWRSSVAERIKGAVQVALLWGSHLQRCVVVCWQSSAGAVIIRHTSQSLEMELGARSWDRGILAFKCQGSAPALSWGKGETQRSASSNLGKVFGSDPGCAVLPRAQDRLAKRRDGRRAAAHPRGVRDIPYPSAAPRHVPCAGLDPADGPPHPGQSVLNQCHPKEFDALARMEQVINWGKTSCTGAAQVPFQGVR